MRFVSTAGVTVLLASLALTTGCSIFGGDDNKDRDRRNDSTSVERPSAIPSAARRVARDTGEISYTAPRDGTVYVIDADSSRVLLSQPLTTGQRVRVDPESDRIRIDDKTVFSSNLESKHRHAIFFADTLVAR